MKQQGKETGKKMRPKITRKGEENRGGKCQGKGSTAEQAAGALKNGPGAMTPVDTRSLVLGTRAKASLEHISRNQIAGSEGIQTLNFK